MQWARPILHVASTTSAADGERLIILAEILPRAGRVDLPCLGADARRLSAGRSVDRRVTRINPCGTTRAYATPIPAKWLTSLRTGDHARADADILICHSPKLDRRVEHARRATHSTFRSDRRAAPSLSPSWLKPDQRGSDSALARRACLALAGFCLCEISLVISIAYATMVLPYQGRACAG
jgi:hypothetical protein